MARSNYIYLVMGCDSVLAGFTVKYEAFNWLNKWRPDAAVFRIPGRGKLGGAQM